MIDRQAPYLPYPGDGIVELRQAQSPEPYRAWVHRMHIAAGEFWWPILACLFLGLAIQFASSDDIAPAVAAAWFSGAFAVFSIYQRIFRVLVRRHG